MARVVKRAYSYDDVLIIPKYNTVLSRKDVDFRTKVTRNHYIDNPLIIANMDTVCESEMAIAMGKLGGLGVLHRFNTIKDEAQMVREVKAENLLCAAALGIKDYEERLEALVEAKVDIIVLDVAHGHSRLMGKVLEFIKDTYPNIDVMVGNIATKEAAEYFLKKGADAIKVGIGPGSMCTTRIMTGAGIPQLSAVMDAYDGVKGEIPICADGGIRYPGDVTKAIGAGADTVMIGSVVSGCDETPGEIIEEKGVKYKLYRGMASYDAAIKKQRVDGKDVKEVISVEGDKTYVEIKGPVERVVRRYLGGLASGMTYVGAKCIYDIKGRVDFVEITRNGVKESAAHGVKNI